MLYRCYNEKNALDAFFYVFKESHINPKMTGTGLVLFKDLPFIGGSPDAIGNCDCCQNSYLIEAKCPHCLAETGISNWKILEYFDGSQNLKTTHTYYNQINLYQGILGIQTAYFVAYAQNEVIIRDIAFDKDFFDFQIKNLSEYYMNYYLPTLIGTKI